MKNLFSVMLFVYVTAGYTVSLYTNTVVFLHSWTAHVDSIKSFICPTNAHKLLQNC